MATSKEAIAICLDISPSMRIKRRPDDSHTPLQLAVECIQWILQRRIFSESKDEIGLVVFGSMESNNPLSQKNQYEHVSVIRELQIVNWEFIKMLDEIPEDCVEADFLDALVVTLDLLHTGTQAKKFGQKSVVLFSTVDCGVCDDQLDKMIAAMKNISVEFAAIGPTFNEEDMDDTQKPKLTQQQIIGEGIIQKIIDSVDGTCLSINQALPLLSYFSRRQANPTAWKCTFEIGLDLRLPICMYVKTKENKIKQSWKYMSAQDSSAKISATRTIQKLVDENSHEKEESRSNGHESEINGRESPKLNEKQKDNDQTVQAFKYGTTLIPLDQLDVEAVRYKNDGKSLKLLAFVHKQSVKPSYFMGDGAHVVLPDSNDQLACTAFSALLKSMLDAKVYALVRYAYNIRSSPRIGALIPEVDGNGLEFFVFITLPFSEDCRFFPFASLNQEILTPDEEQIKCVDTFIDCLNLNRGDFSGNHFNPLEVVNPYIQYVFQCLKHRQLYPNDPLPQPDQELMSTISPDEKLMELAAPFANTLKTTFKLEKMQKVDKRPAANVFSSDDLVPSEKIAKVDADENIDQKELISVKISTIKPVEDFTTVIESDPEKFELASSKLCDVLHQFVFDCIGSQFYSKALECMDAFRKNSIKLLKPGYYNRFISTFKALLTEKDKHAFWNSICEGNFGLIFDEECALSHVTKKDALEFLKKEEIKPVNDKAVAEPVPEQEDLLNELE